MLKRHVTAAALAVSLLFMAEGCKKKVPAPPPPPAPKTAEQPPPAPPKPRPAIASFTVEPSTIERGQSATLRWNTSNASSVSIDSGVGSVDASGSRSVSPSSTTTYTLTARGDGGEAARQTVTLRVTDPPPPPPPPKTTARKTISELMQEYGVQDAYFDYDKHDIREDARSVLTRNADLFKRIFGEVPDGVVTIEGHCDERGSAEYNLGLGDRRSTSARDFLVQLGVPADRLKTISYGKERPQCSESNETCWQKNRRAAFTAQ